MMKSGSCLGGWFAGGAALEDISFGLFGTFLFDVGLTGLFEALEPGVDESGPGPAAVPF